MKYLLSYESFELQREPKVGDWVFMTNWWCGQHLRKFFNDTPGEIIEIVDDDYDDNGTHISYVVKYYEDPIDHLNGKKDEYFLKEFNVTEGFNNIGNWINRFALDKEIDDYKISIDAKKYNL